MKIRSFREKIEALSRRLRELETLAKTSPSPSQPPLYELLEEWHNTVEELRVANEELRVQNEELEASHLAIEEERKRYAELFEFAPDGYVVTDAFGVIREANRGVSTLLNVPLEELIGKPLVVYVSGQKHAAFRTLISQLQAGVAVEEQEIYLQPRKGPPCPVSVKISSLLDPKGKVLSLQWLLRDISLRKQAEEKFLAAMAQLHAFMNAAMDAIITIDEDRRIVMFNSAAEGMFRCSVRETIGQPIERFIPERFRDDHPLLLESPGQMAAKIQAMGKLGKFYGLRGDGEEFPMESSISQIEVGGKKYFTLIHRDITERIRAEKEKQAAQEAIRESEVRFRLLVTSVKDYAIVMLDPHGHVVSWNEGAERIKGYQADEIIGRHFSRFYPPEDIQGGKPEYELKVAAAEGRVEEEAWRVRKDGALFWASVIVSAIRDEAGTLRGFSKVTRDLTEHKRAEAALRASELRFRSVTQSANAAIISADDTGTITSWNKGAHSIFGYAEEEVLGKPLKIIMPERYRDAHEKGMERLRQTGESRLIGNLIELHGLRKDGSELPIELSLSMWGTDQKTFFSGIIQDITERKLAEQKLKESLHQSRLLGQRLEAIREEERTRIAREVHDEMGVGLTCLKFDLSKVPSLVLDEVSPGTQARLDQHIQGILQKIDDTIGQVQRLATDLRPAILDDLGLVAAIEWQAQDFETRTGIPCHFRSDAEDVPLDKDRSIAIFRIFQEALTNVARHAQATRIAVCLWEEGKTLLLEVKDDGRGIPEDKIADTHSLGLLGMRERVMPFGGKVKITGTGSGTLVFVQVPLDGPPLEPEGQV